MDYNIESLIAKVDRGRLKQLTLDFVKIPSPTLHEKEFSEYYADLLKSMGIDVELDYEFPNSPSVIARIKGHEPGPTIQFDGHTDTIPTVHPEPYCEGDIIYGRGTADMKSSLAAIAEMARVFVESSAQFKGEILITVHGLHEAPWGKNETLRSLIEKKIFGDAAVVGELGGTFLPIVGKGLTIFEFIITREGPVLHETMVSPDIVNPIWAGHRLLEILRDKVAPLTQEFYEYVGPDSLFIGIFESGDFYNRVTQKCRIVGTRRHTPKRTVDDVRSELEAVAQQMQQEMKVKVVLNLQRMEEAFQLSKDEKIVKAIRQAYLEVTGKDLPYGGTSTIANGTHLLQWAKVPSVCHAVNSTTAHADLEFVHLEDIVRATEVYIATAVNFLNY
ncbi:M20 family metallopeptidase [Candidatus Poribacteria bacterium]|nr:M20 family metallopeptidase [Candidatus Poribacteria bacterium]